MGGRCGLRGASYYDHREQHIRDLSCGDRRVYLELDMRRVDCPNGGGVKREGLEWLADNPLYTKRFAFYVGRRCRAGTIKDVARELHLDWHTVKALEKQSLRAQLQRVGLPGPTVMGLDEISIRTGQNYRIVVSDLGRMRPIWFGGVDRSEESRGMFYAELGERKRQGIRLAVMDLWKAFRKAAQTPMPQARILFDKFHGMPHLSLALDEVRQRESARLTGKNRPCIQGQKYTLLSHRENLTLDGRRSLAQLLKVNQRLHGACLLKESFDQLWDDEREARARRCLEHGKSALQWQRLKPYEKFVKLVDRPWDGIVAHCDPRNKAPLGFVEGFNNKIRVIQRRAYGLRDEEYLRLKILTCMLPEL